MVLLPYKHHQFASSTSYHIVLIKSFHTLESFTHWYWLAGVFSPLGDANELISPTNSYAQFAHLSTCVGGGKKSTPAVLAQRREGGLKMSCTSAVCMHKDTSKHHQIPRRNNFSCPDFHTQMCPHSVFIHTGSRSAPDCCSTLYQGRCKLRVLRWQFTCLLKLIRTNEGGWLRLERK